MDIAILIAVCFLVMVFLASSIILFAIFHQRKVLNHQIMLKDLAELKQKELLDASIAAEETERNRISSELHDDEAYILHLLELGANSYLMKDAVVEDIIETIVKVDENGFYFSDKIQQLMLGKSTGKKLISINYKPEIELNDREKEVLLYICKELTTAEIAEKVNLSQRRIDGIRHELLNKIQVRNTAGLVVYAIKKGLYFG
jgi:DNA-binding NarL/FixJ family response regulator